MKILTASVLALALALVGCQPSSLRDYRDAELMITEEGPSEHFLKLHVAAYRPPCRPTLSGEIRARFNGIAVAPATYPPTYKVADREFCTDPYFVVPDVGPGDLEIVVDDGAEQFRMKVLSAFAARTWVKDPVDSTTFTPGEQVTLKWYPQTDVVSSASEVSFIDGGGQYVWGDPPVQLDATTFQFTVPATAPPGTGNLTITGEVKPAMTECSGPASCSGPPVYAAVREATVQ